MLRARLVIGDLAAYQTTAGRTLPGVALPALQGGAYVAHLIERSAGEGRLTGAVVSPRSNGAQLGAYDVITL
jgi:NADH dehydrogenase FAD-containing subunit